MSLENWRRVPEKPPGAVEEVLDAFYRAIGTPAPAPGIERLAFIATEAARNALREEWEDELLGAEVKRAVEIAWNNTNPDAYPDVAAEKILEAALGAMQNG